MSINKRKIPSLANWLTSKFIDTSYQEELVGDLKEVFDDRIETRGLFYARLMYWLDALYLIKGFSSFNLLKSHRNNNTIIMIKYFFKMSYRGMLPTADAS